MSDRDEMLKELRKPFPPEVIGKLPRVTCKECSDRDKTCTKHQKAKCAVCNAYVSTAHIHLDFVGHADVTDRLLSVDPEWTWEPFATDADGLPMIRNGTLWIRMTVLGITRVGVGSVEGKTFEPEKQLISDAIRNVAMRFGVALDLWAKGELESTLSDDHTPAAPPAPVDHARTLRRPPNAPPVDSETGELLGEGGAVSGEGDGTGRSSAESSGDAGVDPSFPSLDAMTAAQLAKALQDRGVTPVGNKDALRQQLAEAMAGAAFGGASEMAEAEELFGEAPTG